MLAVARRRLPRGVAVKRAAAEKLPFRDGWFERVTMTLVLHHTDRPAALAEASRVLAHDGRIGILTFDAAQFDDYYLNEYFPALAEVDRARFPSRQALEEELLEAGFGDVRVERLSREQTLLRDHALRRIEGRHISTFQLIPAEEYEAGLERARRELPQEVRNRTELLLLGAVRQGR